MSTKKTKANSDIAEFYDLNSAIKEMTKRLDILKAGIKDRIEKDPIVYKDAHGRVYTAMLNRTMRRSLDQSLLPADVREKAMTEKMIESLSVVSE